ncbi:DUF2332 family protein [Ferrovibrio terrae]|uniref:DUF2332 family protein n=2 Tax=Ferrovibrio terrae TaxID=2594003 RepID=A0A516GZJ7_9PROT|nr:DUF2332 family protein [Ferrovibrio terrae]
MRSTKCAMPSADSVIASFRDQADYCRALGSPFTGMLLDLATERLAANASWAEPILNWPGDPRADALPLRLAGALHRAVLEGGDAPLTAAYAATHITAGDLDAALTRHAALLAQYLQSPPQTNDPQRSAVLLGGFLKLAQLCPGLPLQTCEIGASAGLNQLWDTYAYDFGGWQHGEPQTAPLLLRCRWGGSQPPALRPRVIARAGCDVSPLDARNTADRQRLLSYIWADQPERLARVTLALDHAAACDIAVARNHAADFVAAQLQQRKPDAALVLYHSIVWQYIAAPEQQRIAAAMNQAGATATAQAPLAWLRFEPGRAKDGADLTLTLWNGTDPAGREERLGAGDYHGRWMRWEND